MAVRWAEPSPSIWPVDTNTACSSLSIRLLDSGNGRLLVSLPSAGYFVRNKFDSLSKIPQCSRPLFQVHRTADRVVPYAQGERLFEHAITRKCFITLEGDAHDEALSDGLYARFRQFLKEVEVPVEADLRATGQR